MPSFLSSSAGTQIFLLSGEVRRRWESLRKYRKKRGYTQEKLSGDTGVSREAISRCEGGHSDMKPDALIKLCVKLRVSADVIFGIVPDPHPDEKTDNKHQEDEVSDNYSRFISGSEMGNAFFNFYFCLTPENRAIIQKIVISLYEQQRHGR